VQPEEIKSKQINISRDAASYMLSRKEESKLFLTHWPYHIVALQ
jgi:hypothetical protein